jgi:glycosyltransferase 2 family protein
MRRTALSWGRLVAPAIVLAILVWRLGASPFIAGLRSVNGGAVAAAAGLAVLTTVCCAWRWKIVAGGLGLDLPLPAAVAAYYRSLFLNVTLPGGVLRDVQRGISHGREVGDVGCALRSVAWERFAGQVVQVLLTLVVLLALPSPLHTYMPWMAAAVLAAAFALLLLARARPSGVRSGWARLRSAAAEDIRGGLFARRAWPSIAFASARRPRCHLPTRCANGWRQRAAIADAADRPARHGCHAATQHRGLGPARGRDGLGVRRGRAGCPRGVATAVVYGVMVLVASLPGAVVLVMAWFRRNRPPARTQPPLRGRTAHA